MHLDSACEGVAFSLGSVELGHHELAMVNIKSEILKRDSPSARGK